MIKKIQTLILTLGLLPMTAFAQLTLEGCYEAARQNYPLIQQYALVEQTERFTLENASKGWLPQITSNARASYQSDVTTMPIDLSTMGIQYEGLSKDQYDAHVMITQSLYDGGKIAQTRNVAKAKSEVQTQQLNVTMYAIRERVQQLYFSVLLLSEQIEQQKLLLNDLQLGHNTVEAMYNGGTANQTDIDAVEVEKIKAQQRLGELQTSRHTYLLMLGHFIGKTLDDNTTLAKPTDELPSSGNLRPELAFYQAQNNWYDRRLKALNADIRPKLSAYVQGGVGNPALNMLQKGWDTYYKVGLSLSWNIGALYTRKNDRRLIETERKLSEAERETFLFNTHLQTQQASGKVTNLRQQMLQDDKIITLRQSILDKSEQRVSNGMETVNEMLRNINAVGEARQQRAIHEIQLLQEIHNIKYINNQ